MYLIHEVFYYQVIMLPLLVNFLPSLIHSSLTYDIPKLLLSRFPFVVTHFWVPVKKRRNAKKIKNIFGRKIKK